MCTESLLSLLPHTLSAVRKKLPNNNLLYISPSPNLPLYALLPSPTQKAHAKKTQGKKKGNI